MLRLVFAGSPAVAVTGLERLLASRHEVVAVVTRPDATAGRGRQQRRSDVAAFADAHGIPVLAPKRPAEPEFQEQLAALEPDCCPVIAYGALIPKSALEIPHLGWINLHFSLLPAWRGAAPVQRALLAGDDLTGATVFQIEEGLDTGPVYGTVAEPVRSTDTSGDLLGRLAESGATLLTHCLDAIADGRAAAVAQGTDGVSLAPKLSTDDAAVRWTDPAFGVDRRIRACTPAPGPWTTFRGERLKLGPVTVVAGGTLPPDETLAPGELRVDRHRVLAGTATDAVELGRVQPPGKAMMAADAWARGARPATGERLG